MDTKLCPKCQQTKPVEEFHRLTKSKDGYQCYCKVCNTANARGYFDAEKMRKRMLRAAKIKQKPEAN